MKTIILLLTFIIVFIFTVTAQTVRNTVERTGDRREIATGKDQLERDQEELLEFRASYNKLEEAWTRRDIDQVNSIKKDLVESMKREIQQSKAKLGQDKREISKSNSEVRSDRRENAYNRRDIRTTDSDVGDRRDMQADRRDTRDDRRDASDDRKDFANQVEILMTQERIYEALRTFNFVADEPSREKATTNKALIKEFIDTMEADIWFTKIELGEDKSELREDRRETRDDRRERRERRN
jgi:hypothetical protein